MTLHDRLREIEERVAGHTPGPWLVSRRYDGSLATLYIEDGEDEDDMAVFEHWVGDHCYLVEQEKNATLISHALDLLALARELDAELQEAREIIELFMAEYGDRYGIDGAYDEPMERGRAFLARLEGENND